jgi:hypothetical protein
VTTPPRPEWPPWTDVGIAWQREAWAYIEHLEARIELLEERVNILRDQRLKDLEARP